MARSLRSARVLGVVLAVTVISNVGAQQPTRDLRTPATRIVGHWVTDDLTHYYFGPTDSTDIGPLIWIEANGEGRLVKHRYKVIGEVRGGVELTVQLLFGAGGQRVDQYVVAQDGKTMRATVTVMGLSTTDRFSYVDAKTRPD